jgi:hypothetical protein
MASFKKNSLLFIKRLLAFFGLDYLPYAIGSKKFTADAPFQPTKFKEIKEKLNDLTGEKIDDALSHSKEMLDAENSRGDKIEGKAYNIIGITGIATAFVTGVTSLLSNTNTPIFSWLIPAVYILIVLSLTLTVLLASRAVKVGEYKYAYPEVSDIFNMGSQHLENTKKERLASYLYCYAKNFGIHNIKASYLTASQIWFRNAIILFLFLALTLVSSISQNSNNVVVSPTSYPSIAQTVSVTLPPEQIFTGTPTSIQPTKTLDIATKHVSTSTPITPYETATNLNP